jgi:small subunit ribosomal protein S16
MLKIRLSRGGRNKLPFYRILATNVTSPRDSKFLEKLGTYNPLLAKDNAQRIVINKERIEYWLSVGAQPTEKLAKFLIELGVEGAQKYQPNFKPKNKGEGLKKKALAKLAKENEAKAQAQAKIDAEKAAEAAAKEAPVEAPAEEKAAV